MVFREEQKNRYNKLEAIRLLYSLRGKQEERNHEKGINIFESLNGDARGKGLT